MAGFTPFSDQVVEVASSGPHSARSESLAYDNTYEANGDEEFTIFNRREKIRLDHVFEEAKAHREVIMFVGEEQKG